jgi:hypothetical protein
VEVESKNGVKDVTTDSGKNERLPMSKRISR